MTPAAPSSSEWLAPARVSDPCAIWGVLNLTPDSFSDGGRFRSLPAALAHAQRMIAEGASVVDIGGESSRPAGKTYGAGALKISAAEEIDRVLPVVEALAGRAGVRLSIDTVKAEVAGAALQAGAEIVNDVSGGQSPELLQIVAAKGAEIVLMHTRDRGQVDPQNATYGDVVSEVYDELLSRVALAESLGIARERIWIDPGIGFAKNAGQSAALLRALPAFVDSGYRVLLGTSRKSFIATLAPRKDGVAPPPEQRLGGSLTTALLGALAGVAALRVHDVAETFQALSLLHAIRGGPR